MSYIYIDSIGGLDTNDGKTPETAIKTISQLSKIINDIEAGTNILFKRNCQFAGSFVMTKDGTADAPIIIGAYGEGKMPVIRSIDGETPFLIHSEYVTIENLEFTNPQGQRCIYVESLRSGPHRGMTVRDCFFHDANLDMEWFTHDSGGVTFFANADEPNWFDGITVENNAFDRLARCAVYVYSSWTKRYDLQDWGNKNNYVSDDDGWFPSKNVIVRNNKFNSISGDSVVISGCDGALVEYNTVANSRLFKRIDKRIHFACLWAYCSSNCIFQYNEVYGNSSDYNSDDLQAFDADLTCKNCIFQYNYSHDNAGGFMLFCCYDKEHNGDTIDTIVRYNLSINDGEEIVNGYVSRGIFTFTGEVNNSKIYNNTIYIAKPGVKLFWLADWCHKGASYDNVFSNNIFYAEPGATPTHGIESVKGLTLDNNIFYNIDLPEDENIHINNAIVADPRFVNAGYEGRGLKMGEWYRLKEDSPALSGGLLIEDNGGKDYFGNKTDGKFFGAFSK